MRNNAQGQSMLLLMELARGLAALQKDPKALTKAIEEAYDLEETMKAKVKKAQLFLEEADKVQADIDKQKAELAGFDASKEAALAEQEKAKKVLADIKRTEEALAKREAAIKDSEETLSKSLNAVSAREGKLSQDEQAFQKRMEALALQEAELKEKADKIKSLVA